MENDNNFQIDLTGNNSRQFNQCCLSKISPLVGNGQNAHEIRESLINNHNEITFFSFHIFLRWTEILNHDG